MGPDPKAARLEGINAGPPPDGFAGDVAAQPTALKDPNAIDMTARLLHVERYSGGTLPSRMSMDLAQGPISDHMRLGRAAARLAAQFDLSPDMIFAPYTANNIGQSAANPWYADPVNPAMPVSVATARRFMAANEKTIISRWLQAARQPAMVPVPEGYSGPPSRVPGVEPGTIASIFAAFAPISGENLPLQDALGAAINIARGSKLTPALLQRLQANLAITAQSTSLTPQQQIAAAHTATAKGIVLRSIGDIPGAILEGPFGEMLRAGQVGAQALEATGGVVPPALKPIPGQRLTPAAAAVTAAGGGQQPLGQLNIEFYRKAEAGLLGSGDWFKFLHDTTMDYFAEGQKLAASQNSTPIPFANTLVGRWFGKGLNIINRPLDAAWRALASPGDPIFFVSAAGMDMVHGNLNALTKEAGLFLSPAQYAATGRDILEIIHGHQTAAQQLRDEFGIPEWNSALGELALGMMAGKVPMLQRIIDPLGAGLQSWEAYKAHFLISGLAEDGKSAEQMARFISWRDGPTSRFGDLRNISPVDYLMREASRSNDPEKYFNRATDSFMTYHQSYGIDKVTSDRAWAAIKSMRELGTSDDMIHSAVAGIFDAAIGKEPEFGSLAYDIRSLAEAQQVRSTADVQAEVLAHSGQLDPFAEHAWSPLDAAETPPRFIDTIGPLSTNNPWADQALATLGDAAFDAAHGNIHMLEIPHHANPLTLGEHLMRTSAFADTSFGKLVSSIGRESPRSAGPNMIIPHEGTDAVPDFRRALYRSQVFNSQDRASLELQWSHAIDAMNPTREADITAVIAHVNSEIIRRTNARFGVPKDMEEQILNVARENTKGRSNVFGVIAGEDTAKTIKSPLLASQLDNYSQIIDPVLYRHGISDIMGQVTRWKRGWATMMGMSMPEFELAHAGQVLPPLEKGLKDVVDAAVGKTFLSWWKPLMVMRPAHIMRVVITTEQSKFLAVTGLMRRLESSKWSAKTLQRFGLADDRYLPMGVTLPEGMNQRDNTIEDALLALDSKGPRVGETLHFAPADESIGHAMAEAVRAGGLDPKLRKAAQELVGEYRDALAGLGLNTEQMGAKASMATDIRRSARRSAERAVSNQANIDAGNLRFKIPGLLADDPLADANFANLVMTSAGMNAQMLRSLGPAIGVVNRDDPQFLTSMYAVLQNQFGKDAVGRMMLRAVAEGKPLDQAILEQMAYLTDRAGDGTRYAMRLMTRTKGQSFTAEDLRAKLEMGNNYVRQLTGTHPSLARASYDGGLTMDALKSIPKDELPLYVHGHLVNNYLLRGDSLFGHARDSITHAIMSMPTNVLSRQPFFKSWYDRMYRSLVETEKYRNPGVDITAEKLAGFQTASRNFALDQVDRIMFDYSRSNRFEELTRLATTFTHPFLAFPLTWGRIIRTNPSFLREATLLGRAGLQSGFVKQDPQTGEYVIPESWFGGAAPFLAMATGAGLGPNFKGGGWSLSAPLRAFVAFSESAFPLPTGGLAGDIPIPLPSLSPPFQAALQQFVKRNDLPAAYKARLMSYLFQYGEIGPDNWTGLLPSYLRHGLEAFFPSQLSDITNANATHFLQVQEAMGLKPDAEKARTQARHFAFMRMIFSAIFPAAPQISFPTKPLEEEYRALVDPTTGLGFQAGRAEFLRIHPNLTLLTMARTMWGKDNPSPVPLPANKFVEQLLSGKGAREFAKAHPEWVWAIIPSELSSGKFDAGSFFAQLASGQRVSKSPEAFLTEEVVQKGWDAYFNEATIHTNWGDLNPTLGQTDPGFVAEQTRHERAIEAIMHEHPAWVPEYRKSQDAGVDPNVLRADGGIARDLAIDPIFSQTSVGQGLISYIALHDEINAKLSESNLSSLNTTAAHTSGITSAYEQGVNDIVAAHPDFYTAYRLFFSTDLRTGVETVGQKQIAAISAQDPTFFATQLNPWWTQFEALRTAPDSATDAAGRNAAFEAIRSYVNGSYDTFPANRNPMVLRWDSYSPTDKQAYLSGLIGRPYEYITRFDRSQLMGVPTDSGTENLWSQYEQIRGAITQANVTNPNFSSGAAYKALDQWVLQTAKSSPTFANQVIAANTLGYNFAKLRHQVFTATSPQTDASWASFLDGLGQVQAIVEKFKLHGSGDFDPTHRTAYVALSKALQNQADALSQQDIGFAQQWALLEQWSGSTPAMQQYFMPQSYYAIGSEALVGAAPNP